MNPSFFPAHKSPRSSGRGWGWLRWSRGGRGKKDDFFSVFVVVVFVLVVEVNFIFLRFFLHE